MEFYINITLTGSPKNGVYASYSKFEFVAIKKTEYFRSKKFVSKNLLLAR